MSRLISTISSGTVFGGIVSIAAWIFSASVLAWPVSSDGKCDAVSFNPVSVTVRVARSVVVWPEISNVPMIGVGLPARCTATAVRTSNLVRPGQSMTWGG